jgi:F0F1-type ATP synthase membrane subunit b/b'
MDINSVVKEYVNAHNMPTLPYFTRVRADHVFDENETVKWNREKCKEHNSRYDKECEKMRLSRNIMIDDATKKIYEYIKQEIPGLCEEAVKAIFEKAKDESDDYEYDLSDNIDEYIMFAKIIRK